MTVRCQLTIAAVCREHADGHEAVELGQQGEVLPPVVGRLPIVGGQRNCYIEHGLQQGAVQLRLSTWPPTS